MITEIAQASGELIQLIDDLLHQTQTRRLDAATEQDGGRNPARTALGQADDGNPARYVMNAEKRGPFQHARIRRDLFRLCRIWKN